MERKSFVKNGEIRSWNVENNRILGNLEINGLLVSNPTLEMMYADGWVEYIQPAPTPEQLLDEAKGRKKGEIESYDKSPAICEFYVNDAPYWLTPEERVNYKSTLEDCKAAGRTSIKWWGVTMSIEMAENALRQVNLYAFDTSVVTNDHLAAVSALTSIDAVENYDYTEGYPEKIHFNL